MSLPWRKKLYITLRLIIVGGGEKKSEILKKQKIFKSYGENNYWFSRNIPSEPERIVLENNISIATGVYFCTHDIIHIMLNNDQKAIEKLISYRNNTNGRKKFKPYLGDIVVHDNVFIGAYSTIMYNVSIGPNAIVAANSVVVRDVPPNSIVAGNPAKVIGRYDDLVGKRILYCFNESK